MRPQTPYKSSHLNMRPQTPPPSDPTEGTFVTVEGKLVPLALLTETMVERMTDHEYHTNFFSFDVLLTPPIQ